MDLAGGTLLALLGIFLLLRTVTRDDAHKNLVDHLLAL